MPNLFKAAVPYKNEILPLSEVKKLPYYEELVKVRQAAKYVLQNFPDSACCECTRATHLFTGLEEVAGNYTIKIRGRRLFRRWHAWNYDKERGLYVDITQDQFIESLLFVVFMG